MMPLYHWDKSGPLVKKDTNTVLVKSAHLQSPPSLLIDDVSNPSPTRLKQERSRWGRALSQSQWSCCYSRLPLPGSSSPARGHGLTRAVCCGTISTSCSSWRLQNRDGADITKSHQPQKVKIFGQNVCLKVLFPHLGYFINLATRSKWLVSEDSEATPDYASSWDLSHRLCCGHFASASGHQACPWLSMETLCIAL